MKLDRVLIYGMGLMGGSLSLTIREKFPKAKIFAVVRSEKSKNSIIQKKLADQVLLNDETFSIDWDQYDLVVFSTPVTSVLKLIPSLPKKSSTIFMDLGSTKQSIVAVVFSTPVTSVLKLIPSLPKKSSTIFMDLGSTKQSIVAAVDQHFGNFEHNYISAHPMCGSEQTGPLAAIPNLYQDKLCILTKPKAASQTSFEAVNKFWETIGSWTIPMDANVHDETLAYVSHLPHVISTILVNVAGKNKTTMEQVSSITKPITGGGFRDMSRIAGSNAEMWASIFEENKVFLKNSIDDFIKELNEFRKLFQEETNLDESSIHSIWDLALKQKEIIQKTK